MTDEERKVVIYRVSESYRDEASGYQQPPVSPIKRWLSYAILIPIVVMLGLAGVFFFAAFLALAAVLVAIIVVRFWWMRRKFEHAMHRSSEHTHQKSEVAETTIIEDAQIIEEAEVQRTQRKDT